MTQIIIDIPKVYILTSVCRYGGKHMIKHTHRSQGSPYGATSGCNHESGTTGKCNISLLVSCKCGASGRYCTYHNHIHWNWDSCRNAVMDLPLFCLCFFPLFSFYLLFTFPFKTYSVIDNNVHNRMMIIINEIIIINRMVLNIILSYYAICTSYFIIIILLLLHILYKPFYVYKSSVGWYGMSRYIYTPLDF